MEVLLEKKKKKEKKKSCEKKLLLARNFTDKGVSMNNLFFFIKNFVVVENRPRLMDYLRHPNKKDWKVDFLFEPSLK